GTVAADAAVAGAPRRGEELPEAELSTLIQELTTQMHQAATDLRFELAARLRDEVSDLKKELRQMREATG
ncbi:MAG: UvrB/UvrC motif-containing protein, partial [Ornithinimicrobium sp.]